MSILKAGENVLKRLLAGAMLDKAGLKDLMTKIMTPVADTEGGSFLNPPDRAARP